MKPTLIIRDIKQIGEWFKFLKRVFLWSDKRFQRSETDFLTGNGTEFNKHAKRKSQCKFSKIFK